MLAADGTQTPLDLISKGGATLEDGSPWFEFLALLDSGFDWMILKYTNDFASKLFHEQFPL